MTILDTIPRGAILRNLKTLLGEYDPEEVKRAIALAGFQSEYPYSTKYIEDVLGELGYERNSNSIRSGEDQEGSTASPDIKPLWD